MKSSSRWFPPLFLMMISEALNLWGCRWEWPVSVWINMWLSLTSFANCHYPLHRNRVSTSPRWLERSKYHHQSHRNITNLSWWDSNPPVWITLYSQPMTVDVWHILFFHYLLGILDTCACGSLTWLGARDSWLCQEGQWCFYLVRRTGMEWQLSYMMERWGAREPEPKIQCKC